MWLRERGYDLIRGAQVPGAPGGLAVDRVIRLRDAATQGSAVTNVVIELDEYPPGPADTHRALWVLYAGGRLIRLRAMDIAAEVFDWRGAVDGALNDFSGSSWAHFLDGGATGASWTDHRRILEVWRGRNPEEWKRASGW